MMIFNGYPEVSDLLMPQQLVDDISNLLPDSASKELKEEFMSYQHWVKSDEQSEPKVGDETKDFRFNWLLVRNFRRYDKVDAQPDAHFGMKLQDENGEVCSKMFVLGQNGVGKSTLFNAAEYLFTGRISEAVYRHIHPLQSYMGGQVGETVVVTKDGRSIRETPRIPLPLSRFFISENSILEASGYIADQDNWYSFFCEMLGVGEVYRLINQTLPAIKETIEHLDDLVGTQQQRYERLLLVLDMKQTMSNKDWEMLELLVHLLQIFLDNPRKSLINELIKQLRYVKLKSATLLLSDLKTARNQLLNIEGNGKQQSVIDSKAGFGLDDNRKDQQSQVIEEVKLKVSKYIDLLEWLIDRHSAKLSLDDIETELMSEYVKDGGTQTTNRPVFRFEMRSLDYYCQSAQKALNTFVSRFVDQSFKQTVEDLYVGHFLEEGETFTFDIDHIAHDAINITISRGTEQIPANRYFNMFRFRLFFLSVQSILCIKMMQETGISFPLLFDDVFYANDYINKRQLVRFFQMLDEFVAKNDRVKGRMQLVFFSHDEQLVSVIHSDQMGKIDGTVYFRMVDSSLVSSCAQSICSVETVEGELACCQVTLPIYTKQYLV